jgi:hypothetical protein
VNSEDAAGAQRQPEQPAPTSTPKPRQGEVLLQLAADLDLFHDPNRAPYATFAVEEHRETHSLRSHEVRDYLAQLFFRQEGKPPNANAIQDALSVLSGRARFDGPKRQVSVRVAEHDGAIYLDLGDAAWHAVKITSGGWCVVNEPPVRFRRPRGMLPLPMPVAGGSLGELWQLVNVPVSQRVLVAAWLVAAFRGPGRSLPAGGALPTWRPSAVRHNPEGVFTANATLRRRAYSSQPAAPFISCLQAFVAHSRVISAW